MLDSEALTKIQSIILIVVIVVAAVGAGVAYVLLIGNNQASGTIKIGVLADLDSFNGKKIWQGTLLAAEQINSEGGLLGKQIEVIGADHDIDSGVDVIQINSALTKLITFNKVDFVIGQGGGQVALTCQEIVAEHKIIFIDVNAADESSQRVLDNYNKYKYYFSTNWNETSIFQGMTDGLLMMREINGFNNVGIISESWGEPIIEGLEYVLPELYGFDLVYQAVFPYETVDFSSYYAAAEAAGVEVLLPLISADGGIPFVKEYYDRQSPLFIYGGVIIPVTNPESWEWTDGKCENIITAGWPITTGYPLTRKTLSAREAYINRWNATPAQQGAMVYDIIRFILPDAIERARTIETDAVIEALEQTSIETSMAKNFVFTSAHVAMVGENPVDPNEDYLLILLFQWQNGEQVPVYPKKIMEEAGATYTYPPWPGPWDTQ